GGGKLTLASQRSMRRSKVWASSPSEGLGFGEPNIRIMASREVTVAVTALRQSTAASEAMIRITRTTMPISGFTLNLGWSKAHLLDQLARSILELTVDSPLALSCLSREGDRDAE